MATFAATLVDNVAAQNAKLLRKATLCENPVSYSAQLVAFPAPMQSFKATLVDNVAAQSARLRRKATLCENVSAYSAVLVPFPFSAPSSVTYYLHRAWSPDNNAVVFWEDTIINLSPVSTIPSSVVANLANKEVMGIRMG